MLFSTWRSCRLSPFDHTTPFFSRWAPIVAELMLSLIIPPASSDLRRKESATILPYPSGFLSRGVSSNEYTSRRFDTPMNNRYAFTITHVQLFINYIIILLAIIFYSQFTFISTIRLAVSIIHCITTIVTAMTLLVDRHSQKWRDPSRTIDTLSTLARLAN